MFGLAYTAVRNFSVSIISSIGRAFRKKSNASSNDEIKTNTFIWFLLDNQVT